MYRRVIEIRDGWLALRPYADPRVAELARKLCRENNVAGQDAEAAIEAASLVAAEWAKAHDKIFDGGSGTSVPLVDGSDMSAEVTLLERVAHAYGHSSIVQTIRNQLDLADNPTATRKASVAEES